MMTTPLADRVVAASRRNMPAAARALSDVDGLLASPNVDSANVDRPVFVTGLPRAGTTIVTEILASLPGVATHRYKDRPLPEAPALWRRFEDAFGGSTRVTERAHGDGLTVGRDSPEAADEPIWRAVTGHTFEPEPADWFVSFYRHHVARMIALEGASRFVAKNNEHVGRLRALTGMFEAPAIVVVVRDPSRQVASLMRQHDRLLRQAEENGRVARHLADIGHTEFGPYRTPPIAAGSWRGLIANRWRRGKEVAGWAEAWSAVYRHVVDMQSVLNDRIKVLDYDDLVATPDKTLDALGTWLGCREAMAAAIPEWSARLKEHTVTSGHLDPADRRDVEARTAHVQAWLETAELPVR